MLKFILSLILILGTSLVYAIDFDYNGMWFELTSAGSNPTCALTMPPKGYKFPKRFVIPSTVKYKDVDVKVTRIKARAFAGAKKIRTIVVPSSITYIERNSFSKDREPSYILNFEFSITCDSLIFEDGSELVELSGRSENRNCNYPNAKYLYLGRNLETEYKLYDVKDEASGGAFHYMFSLKDLVIGDLVTNIPKYAFKGLKELSNIKFGQNITMIGDFAFSKCSLLNNVHLPDGLTLLGFDVFDSCESLTSITFREEIKKIDFDFTSCENLIEIVCHAPVPPELSKLEPSVFFNATLFVPSESVALYREAQGWKDFLKIVELKQ